MFKSLRATESKTLNHSGRSYVGETLQLEGDLRSSGAIDVAGLINGSVFVSEINIAETGSIRGALEANHAEINGHLEGKILAKSIVIGSSGVVKGDILFSESLKTEEGADINGYLKKTESTSMEAAQNEFKLDTIETSGSKEKEKSKKEISRSFLDSAHHFRWAIGCAG